MIGLANGCPDFVVTAQRAGRNHVPLARSNLVM